MRNKLLHTLATCSLCILFAIEVSCGTSKEAPKQQLVRAENTGAENLSDSLFYKAILLKTQEKYQDALLEFRKFSVINPGEPAPYYHMAEIYALLKNYKDALSLIEKAYTLDNTNPFYRVSYANLLAMNGEYEKGAKLFDQLLIGKNKKIDYLYSQYIFYKEAENYKKMRQVIAAMETYTFIDEAYIDDLKIETYALMGDKNQLEKILTKQIKKNPSDYTPKLKLAALYNLTKEYDKLKKLKETFDFKDGSRENKMAYLQFLVNSNDMITYERLAESIFSGANPDKESVSVFTESYVNLIMTRDHFNSSRVIKKMSEISQKLTAIPEAPEFLIGFYSAVGMEDSTYKYTLRALDLKTKNKGIILDVYNYHNSRKNYDSVMHYAQKYLNHYDKYDFAHYIVGLVHQRNKNYNEAITSYFKAIADSDASKYVLISSIYHNIAICYEQEQKIDSAMKYNNYAVEVDSGNAIALNNYAYQLAQKNIDLDKAEYLSKKSLDISPNSYTYLDTYGWIKYQQGDYETARKYILKAIEVSNTSDPVLWDHLGDIELKLGNKTKAVEYWENAYKLSPLQSINDKIKAHK